MSKTVNTTHASFNLIDFIDDITNFDVAAKMAQAVAWRIDTLIQTNARQLFKNVRTELLKTGVDGIAELNMALKEQAFAEHAFNESGSAVTGPVTLIKELMLHRDAAHEQAERLTALTLNWQGEPGVYETPDIDELFERKVELKVNRDTKRRIAISVDRRAKAYGLSDDQVQLQVTRRIARAEDKQQSKSETLQEQSGAVHEMFRLACMSEVHGELGDQFHTMDINTQRVLIESAINAAERAEDDATDNNRLSDAEFDDICMCVMKVSGELNKVIKSSRFVVRAQQDAAVAANLG